MNKAEAVDGIKEAHRYRRYAIKQQQKIDRALESFIRINATDWTWTEDEKEKKKFAEEVARIIKAARNGEGHERIVKLVQTTDRSREPFDLIRKENEKLMETHAKSLPAAAWVASVHGAGLLGFATIVGEGGDLSRYPNVAKLWKRLGFAPFDGLAGSTWKRESWRPRALSKEEWIHNPFSAERYASMHQIAIWLVNSQWIGAKKSETGEGKPNGPYGEIYAARRAHTAAEHPDWTKQHSRMDGLRVAMKAFLRDLFNEWRRCEGVGEGVEVAEAAE
jgi:hypothetical protein